MSDPENVNEKVLPLLPLRDVVIYPYMLAPLFVGREKSIKALEEAAKGSKEIFLSAQKDAKVNEPGNEDMYRIGTIGTIVQMLRLPDGTREGSCRGQKEGLNIRLCFSQGHVCRKSKGDRGTFGGKRRG